MAIKERYQVDEKINPGDDFYKYVCGKWMKNNPLPKAYSRYGIFHKLNDENEEKINTILDELEKKELYKRINRTKNKRSTCSWDEYATKE